jgi:hypothetical protein
MCLTIAPANRRRPVTSSEHAFFENFMKHILWEENESIEEDNIVDSCATDIGDLDRSITPKIASVPPRACTTRL